MQKNKVGIIHKKEAQPIKQSEKLMLKLISCQQLIVLYNYFAKLDLGLNIKKGKLAYFVTHYITRALIIVPNFLRNHYTEKIWPTGLFCCRDNKVNQHVFCIP